jgi:hypothetical protein
MSTNTGVVCECNTCGGAQWYDNGVCQGCSTDQGIEYTWVAKSGMGGAPSAAPAKELRLGS